jgi:hypothetical protein
MLTISRTARPYGRAVSVRIGTEIDILPGPAVDAGIERRTLPSISSALRGLR